MKKALPFATAFLLFGFGPALRAQDAQIPQKLTLADALRLAAERNPEFAAARNAVEVAEAQRLDASQRPNPALTFESEGYPLFDNPRPPFASNQTLTLRFDQEIETAGRRRLRTQVADVGVEVTRAQSTDVLRRLELDVRRAYLQAVLAKADRDVASAALGEIDRVITLNRARFEKGEISGGELRRIQVERLKFIDDVFGAELALKNARSALLALLNVADLGYEFDTVESLTDGRPSAGEPLTVSGLPLLLDRATLRQQALANRPDIAAARGELTRADTETRLQRALRTPNLTVGGGYQRDFGSNAVVFGATVPLPLFNRNAGGVARAQAERRLAESRSAAVTAAIALDVQQAVNAVEINRARVQYIEREYLKNARESRDIVLASYRVGTADLIDFLDAQRAFRDTLRTYNRALYEERISTFELAAAVGKPAIQP